MARASVVENCNLNQNQNIYLIHLWPKNKWPQERGKGERVPKKLVATTRGRETRGERGLTLFPSPMSSPLPTNCPISAVNRPCPSPTVPRSRHREPSTRVAGRINIRENSRPRTAQTFPRPPGKSAALFMEDLTSFHTWRREEEEHAILLPHQCPGGTCGGTRAVKETRGAPQTLV
jgi:hypothetical protein